MCMLHVSLAAFASMSMNIVSAGMCAVSLCAHHDLHCTWTLCASLCMLSAFALGCLKKFFITLPRFLRVFFLLFICFSIEDIMSNHPAATAPGEKIYTGKKMKECVPLDVLKTSLSIEFVQQCFQSHTHSHTCARVFFVSLLHWVLELLCRLFISRKYQNENYVCYCFE